MLLSLALMSGVLVLVAVLSFAIYDLRVFQPRQGEIDAIVSLAQPAEKKPPAPLIALLETEYRGDFSAIVTRILLFDLRAPESTYRNFDWAVSNTIWRQLVRLHLSHEAQRTILCSRIFLGRRAYGFAAGAREWFGKPLDALDEAEFASLVVVQRRPSFFARPENAARRARARDDLLKRKRAALIQDESGPPLTSP